jgi:organic hydroperoxide reductase OsmC/OhrA
MKLVAGGMKVRMPIDAAVDTEVDLGTTDGEYLIQARLNVSLPGIDVETARIIAEKAHHVCPYSKATSGNINVVTEIMDSAAASGA